MTPIIIPLSEQSQWADHQELRFLIRSAVQNVTAPWFIIVGHLPKWVSMEANAGQTITDRTLKPQLTHLPFPDSMEQVKDHNMMLKVAHGCQYLAKTAPAIAKKGFIRCSDDQLFLKPYRPAVYHTGLIMEYMEAIKPKKKDGLDDTTRIFKMLSNDSFQGRIARTLIHFHETLKKSPFNFDCHLPQWYFNTDTFLRMMDENEELIKEGVTINSFYYNQPYVYNLITKDFPGKDARFGAQGILENHVEKAYVIDFMRDTKKWDFLSYNEKALTNRDGHVLKAWMANKFPTKSPFE